MENKLFYHNRYLNSTWEHFILKLQYLKGPCYSAICIRSLKGSKASSSNSNSNRAALFPLSFCRVVKWSLLQKKNNFSTVHPSSWQTEHSMISLKNAAYFMLHVFLCVTFLDLHYLYNCSMFAITASVKCSCFFFLHPIFSEFVTHFHYITSISIVPGIVQNPIALIKNKNFKKTLKFW